MDWSYMKERWNHVLDDIGLAWWSFIFERKHQCQEGKNYNAGKSNKVGWYECIACLVCLNVCNSYMLNSLVKVLAQCK